MTVIPEVITHNYDPARGIGRNICDLPFAAAQAILDDIRASGTRQIRQNYLNRRHAVEDWLIEERRRLLGNTALHRPIYFFLGAFADGRDPSRPASLVMPLSAFRPNTLTFTYPDSMASLPIATRDEHLLHRKAYHGRVFTLSEIESVISEFGLPGDRWRHDAAMRYDRFIEIQVWDEGPISNHLARTQPWHGHCNPARPRRGR